MTLAHAPTTDGILSNPPLRRLQISTAATSFGKWAFALALGVYAFRKGGAAAVGLVALIQAIPAAISAPVLGLAGDRFSRQRVLLVTNLTRSLLLGLIAAAVLLHAPIGVVFALAVVFSIVSTANQPARAALIPVLARTPREVSSATAMMGSVDIGSFLVGAGIGGIVLANTSVQFVVAICSVAYLVASYLMFEIPRDGRPAMHKREHPLAELAAGFKAVHGESDLRLSIGMISVLSVIDGLTNVLVIVTAIDLLDTGTAGIGYLNIAYGIGGLLGGSAAYALLRQSHLTRTIAIGSLALGLPLAMLGWQPSEPLGLVAWAGVGFGIVSVKVAGLTLVQRLSGDRVLARVLAVVETTFVASIGAGAMLAPLLISTFDVTGALIATGALLPIVIALRWRALRQLELGAPVPQQEFELLRHCPVFSPLPLATTESLAGRVARVEFEAGDEIIRQGDEGDRFYVIASGSVAVFEDGAFRRNQSVGESFGEIALLRSSPRTATVKALEHCELLALDREPFLRSVTGYADSHEAAVEVSEQFLAPITATN